jgi:competence ComEA-like helix-hairpin-helix protein
VLIEGGISMFNLTRQERQVILFLATIALIGIGINFLVKMHSPIKTFVDFNQNDGKLNLNKADKEALIAVSGIGEKLAERLIEYRAQRGGFVNLEDAKNVKGITNNRYEKLKESFFVE